MVKNLQKEVTKLKQARNGGNTNPGGGGRNNGGGNNNNDTNNVPAWWSRNNVSEYCWTHGACAHKSSDCRNKADGHKNNATFTNKMGGSCAFCPDT